MAYFFTERENRIEVTYYATLNYPIFVESKTTIITSASECYIAKGQDVVADVVLGCYLSIRIIFCLYCDGCHHLENTNAQKSL